MTDELVMSDQHTASGRWAVLEDDGSSAWLYLTEPNSQRPIADCWIYNRVPDSEPSASYRERGMPPPAPREVAGAGAQMQPEDFTEFRFLWSEDGGSVALYFKGALMAFVASDQGKGYNRNLVKRCPWGNPLDASLYESLFG